MCVLTRNLATDSPKRRCGMSVPIIEIDMPLESGPLSPGLYQSRLVNVQRVTGKYGEQIELTFAVEPDGRTIRAWINPKSRQRVQECLSVGLASLGNDGKVRFGGKEWRGAIYVNERGRVSGFVPAQMARGLIQSQYEEVHNG
jgi:hypothetical protein